MRHPGGKRLWLLAQTVVALAVARLALRVVPVSRILGWQGAPVREAGSAAEQARQRDLVRWAVEVVARRAPIQFVCFPRCLAGSFLLRRRGVASKLHYGVTREDGRLATHTWLESGDEVLVGGDVKDGYATLGVF